LDLARFLAAQRGGALIFSTNVGFPVFGMTWFDGCGLVDVDAVEKLL
jgi:hypothetical protein